MTGIEKLVQELRGVAGLPASLYPMARAAEQEARDLASRLRTTTEQRDDARRERDELLEAAARGRSGIHA